MDWETCRHGGNCQIRRRKDFEVRFEKINAAFPDISCADYSAMSNDCRSQITDFVDKYSIGEIKSLKYLWVLFEKLDVWFGDKDKRNIALQTMDKEARQELITLLDSLSLEQIEDLIRKMDEEAQNFTASRRN
jgi:hypothetical protein